MCKKQAWIRGFPLFVRVVSVSPGFGIGGSLLGCNFYLFRMEGVYVKDSPDRKSPSGSNHPTIKQRDMPSDPSHW